MVSSVPLALGYSLHTLRAAGDRGIALAALSLASLEAVALTGLLLRAIMRT
jgi:hypothetical protein